MRVRAGLLRLSPAALYTFGTHSVHGVHIKTLDFCLFSCYFGNTSRKSYERRPKLSNKSKLLTMKSRTGSLFLKFYDEQIIEYWGTAEEKSKVAEYATKILEINNKMKSIRDALKVAKPDESEKLKADLETLKQSRIDANSECSEYCAGVVADKGYYASLCSHLRSIPCVSGDGRESVYNWTDCYYLGMIKHDKDYLADDIWNPTVEKVHYHLAIRTMPCPGKRTRQLEVSRWLDLIKISYRPGIDDSLMINQGVDVCKSFNDCILYLMHATAASMEDGKYPYIKEEVIHNMIKEYFNQILLGASRLDINACTMTVRDWEQLEAAAIDWGSKGLRWRDFMSRDNVAFKVRARFRSNDKDAKEVMHSYFEAMEEYLSRTLSDFVRNSIYIEGHGGCGKSKTSRLALHHLGYSDDDIFDVGKGSAKYDAYNDERCLICEDRGLDDIRRVTESNYCRLRKRNSGESLWYGDCVVITQNRDFDEFCMLYTLGSKVKAEDLTPSDKDSIEATKSRFTYFKCDDSGYIHLMKVSYRESYEKRVDMGRFAYEFQNAYNRSRFEYLSTSKFLVDDEFLLNCDFSKPVNDLDSPENAYRRDCALMESVYAQAPDFGFEYKPSPCPVELDTGKLHFGYLSSKLPPDLPWVDKD